MDKIKAHFQTKIGDQISEIKDFLAAHGDEKIGDIKVSQLYGGMRGMQALICETSKLDPDEGSNRTRTFANGLSQGCS